MWNYIHIYFQYAIKEDKKTQRYYNILKCSKKYV